MTTLIAVYNSDGCVGRCDAKCYDAAHADCQCICGGKNHGAGKEQALAQATQEFEAWIEEYAKNHEFDEVVVPAIYKTQTQGACKIARSINKLYGYNVVTDVEYRGRGKKGGWHLTGKIRNSFVTPDGDVMPSKPFLAEWHFKSAAEAVKSFRQSSADADIWKPAAQLAFA